MTLALLDTGRSWLFREESPLRGCIRTSSDDSSHGHHDASGHGNRDDGGTRVHGLLDRDLIVVTGKGGVGTSTVAAALGLLAASRGMRAIVAETGGHADCVRLLAGSGVDHVSIAPRAAMEEYLHHRLPSRALSEMLAASGMFTSFVMATPG